MSILWHSVLGSRDLAGGEQSSAAELDVVISEQAELRDPGALHSMRETTVLRKTRAL